MTTTLYEDLKTQVNRRRAVALIGAGVSIGATASNSLASWKGLLHHGIDRCVAVRQHLLPADWAARIHQEVDSGDVDDLLAAAEKVSSKLGAPDGGEYRLWLRETVGSLRPEHPDVIEALHQLGVVLATTNYDSLIEQVTKVPAVTWMDGPKVERVLRGDEEGILHLHGYWDRPESIVLGVTESRII